MVTGSMEVLGDGEGGGSKMSLIFHFLRSCSITAIVYTLYLSVACLLPAHQYHTVTPLPLYIEPYQD